MFSLLLFCTTFSFAQTTIITGKVINAETGLPLAGASVFAENTTIGTATDDGGNFKLWLPDGGYDLVASFTGFGMSSKRITTSNTAEREVNFMLKVREKEISDVTVVASNEVKDGWDKYGTVFWNEFIGETDNSKWCTIQNKEALHFFYSKKRNRLKVLADEPIVVKNMALGYVVKYALDSFVHEFSSKLSVYTGSPLFESIASTDSTQLLSWELARQNAYNGSILHFMRSVYDKALSENDFQIQFIVNYNQRDTAIKLKDWYGALRYTKNDSLQTVSIQPRQNNLGVIYTKEKPSTAFLETRDNEPKAFQFSILTFPQNQVITIEKNGYYFDQNDLVIQAYWTWEKVADLLPYDYE